MKKGFYSTALAVLLIVSVFVLPILNPGISKEDSDPGRVDKAPAIITDTAKKPISAQEVNVLKSDETVTFIVETEGTPLCDVVRSSKGKYTTVAQLLSSKDARQYIDTIKKNQAVVKAGIRKMISSADLDNSYTYNSVICGFSLTAPYSTLKKLQGITGVKSVTLASEGKIVISEKEDEDDSEKALSEEKKDSESPAVAVQYSDTGADGAYEQGYTGKGRLIAVIDDSFFTAHEAFSAKVSAPEYTSEDIAALTSAVPFNTAEKTSVYINSKVVFAYDYADRDNNTYSSASSHGTKVASVAAGNNGTTFKSGAWNAQLALMKVCGDSSETVNDAVLLAAIDDAAKLSPDIVNISLGVPRLCVTAGLFDRAIEALSDVGCHVVAAAGNYSENVDINEDYGIRSSYTDYGTISYPSSLSEVTSVGASNTSSHYGNTFITDKNNKFEYAEIATAHDEVSPKFSEIKSLTEYCYTDSYGSEDELKLFDLKDKIAVVKRGMITVDEKIKAAEKLRAAGILIISDEPLYIGFTAEKRDIPAAAAGSASLSYFSSHPQGKLCSSGVSDEYKSVKPDAPAPFTSYGVSSDLRLKPDILSPGTDLYCADNDSYSQITGTSASAAGVSAAAAILYEYTDKIKLAKNERHRAVNALMMNNADRLKYNNDLYYTPRIQGAGRIDIKSALAAPVYITADGISPAVSLGESPDGKYGFTLTVNSISDKDVILSLNNLTQTDRLISMDDKFYNTLTPVSLSEYTKAVFKHNEKEINELTVPAGESIDIDVELTLSPAAALSYMRMAPNGFYIDGYIEFTEKENGNVHSVPYMGYCGSWEIGNIFDSTVYDSDEQPLISGSSLYAAAQVGNYYEGIQLGTDLKTGKKDRYGICIGKDAVMNYTDSPTAGASFIIPDYYLLRDAADYTISIKNSKGKTIFSQKLGNISSFASGGYKAYTGLLQSFNADGLKNLFSTLDEGKYTYVVSASSVPYSTPASSPAQSVSYDFIVDNTVPSKPNAKTYAKDGRIYLELSSSDRNGIRDFMLYTASGGKNKYHYGDKLDDLIGNSYMNEDSYTLISKEYKDDKAVFTYDITYLYNQLKRVKIIAASINIDSLTELKLAVRAVDSAFNLSETAIADSCVSGSITYHLTDQNDKPVEGVKMALGETIQTSDKYGVIKFSSVLPNYYGVKLISVPDEYTTSFTSEAVFTSLEKTDYSKSIHFEFSGEYPVEESISENSVKPDEAIKVSEKKTDYFENDNSVFGLVFISLMIVVFCAAIIFSKLSRKKSGGDHKISV